MEMVTLRAFNNYFSANIMLSKLQEAGIDCYLVDENTATLYPVLLNAIGGIKLTVAAKDAEVAVKLVEEFEAAYLQTVKCPKCGGNHIELVSKPAATNYITAILTWLFSSYAVAPEKIYQCQDCHYESASLPENFSDEDNAVMVSDEEQ